MGQRLAVIGFILAVILAIFMFTQQQQTLKLAQDAQTEQAQVELRRGTSEAMAQSASDGQATAEGGQANAVATAQSAASAQADSDHQRETAVAQAQSAGTLSVEMASAATAQSGTAQAAQAEAESQGNQLATLQAETTAEMGTAQAQIDAQSTTQAGFDAALGTATAQVDLAQFALQAAEEDRGTALAQFWIAATVVADQANTQATAQAVVSGVTAVPTLAPAAPTAAPTTAIEPTTAGQGVGSDGAIPPLTAAFISNDKKLTFNYPEGWIAADTGQGEVIVVSSQAILQRTGTDLQSGEMEIQVVYVGPKDSLRGVAAGATPSEVIKAIRDIYTQQNKNPLSDNAVLTVGQHDAARFQGTEGNNAAITTVVDLGNDIVALTFAFVYPGETDRYIQTLDDLLGSMQYSTATS